MDDDTASQIARSAAAALAGESDPVSASTLRRGHKAHAARAKRDGNGKFVHMVDPKPPHEPAKRVRSRVTNGRALFLNVRANTAESRRFHDILRAIVSDLGGRDMPLSEGQRQLARRAASLSVACEKLEQAVCTGTSAAEAAFLSAAGGLSPYVVLRESSRVLHAVARTKGGDTITAIAKLPADELGRVTDLLVKAGDLAARAINAGSAQTADLELLGELSDRLGRTFARLGMARVPKEVGIAPYAARTEVWSPLKDALARDAKAAQPVDADQLEPIDVTSEAAE
jgi:hypothetical protein